MADENRGVLVENSAFQQILGSPGKAKILEVLLSKHDTQLNQSEIAELAGVNQSTVSRNLDQFVSSGIVQEVDKRGQSRFYKLNTQSEISKSLGKLRSAIIESAEDIERDGISNSRTTTKKDSGFDSIIESALEEAEKNFTDEFDTPSAIAVGCGGAGNNTINRLFNIGSEGAETVAINTDKQHLKQIQADTKILVGKSITNGLGAGGDPSIGRKSVEMAEGTIKEVLSDANLAFITAGLGGGTGTGAAPAIAKMAKEEDLSVIAIVSSPFNVERARLQKSRKGAEDLKQHADSVVVMDNNQVLEYAPNLPIGKAFSVMDQIIAESIRSISSAITQRSLVNIDYTSIQTVLEQDGLAAMLVGEAQGDNKQEMAARNALDHPLLDADFQNATGGIIHITGGPDLTLQEAEDTVNEITKPLNPNTNIIWGATIQEDYDDRIKVMSILSGIDDSNITQDEADERDDLSILNSSDNDFIASKGGNEDVELVQ